MTKATGVGRGQQGERMIEHRHAAQDEDIRFLMENGESLEAACRRVGVLVGTYEQRQKRSTDERVSP